MGCNTISFSNSNEEPTYLQIDPWAALYLLKKNEKITNYCESDNYSPTVDIVESGTTRVLSIYDSAEYFVVVNGKRIHFSEYLLDERLCPYCIQPHDPKDWIGKFCKCDR